MRDRANSVKNLASTFDREIENFLNNSSRSAFSADSPSTSSFSNEIGIMKKLQPKVSEFRRVYSAPEISRKVMERWGPARAKLGIDLSAIKKAIKSLKSRLKEFEKGSSLEILSGFKNSEFLEKLKTSFKSIYKETDEAKDVPPLDVPELLACLVYKVFINPSISDVLCTATAEALAWCEFFRSFPNCLTYKTSEDFVSKVKEAMSKEPLPLTPEQMYTLSWEAATQRFMEYSDLDKILNDGNGGRRRRIRKSRSVPSLNEVIDGGLAFTHYVLTGNDLLRLCTEATPRTKDYEKQHCKDLNLVPPLVHKPIFGW